MSALWMCSSLFFYICGMMFVVELVSLSEDRQLFHTTDRNVLAVHIYICMTFCFVYGSICLLHTRFEETEKNRYTSSECNLIDVDFKDRSQKGKK